MESSEIETIWIQFKDQYNKTVLLNFVYRPPDSKQSWIDYYEEQLILADKSTFDWYIVGDFNIVFNTPNTYSNSKWSKIVNDYGLSQLIHTPTRVTKRSSTIIDHIYVSCTENISDIQVPCLGISDHYPVAFTIGEQVCLVKNTHKLITYRSFKNFDENAFINDLESSNLSLLKLLNDPNEIIKILYNILNSSLSKHAPLKSKRVKTNKQPAWYTDEVKQARCLRDKYKTVNNFDQYKIWRNKCNSIIKKSKKTVFNEAIKEKKEPKYIWQNIKNISNNDDPTVSLPHSLRINDINIAGKQNVADALNNHFVNIAKIVNKIKFDPNNYKSIEKYLNEKLRHNYFEIDLITPYEVSLIIDKLDINKASGVDRIGPRILKLCKDSISEVLASLINSCISSGVFPDTLKIASVIPLHKGGAKDDPNNYRPISLLPTISKIIERHVVNKLNDYLKKTNILMDRQSGFRQHHSCQTALIKLVDSWLTAIDDGHIIGSVFLDFKKAFDLVDHKILLHKLKLYHFSQIALKFFDSYLSNRLQLINIDGVRSKTSLVSTGVPQGSILGPVLFLLYVNDLPLEISSETDMYADDTTLHNKGRYIHDIQAKLQLDIDRANNWCIKNNMVINPAKTTCMVIGPKQKVSNSCGLSLCINGMQITNVSSQKLLGVHIDNNLSWKTHIDKTCGKINSRLNLLKRIRYFLNQEIKQLFYNAYIAPLFDYGCITWQGASVTEINRITKLQCRAGRIILNVGPLTSSTDVLTELKWLSFPKRCNYYTALLTWKSQHNLTPLYIKSLLTFSTNNKYNLRSTSRKDLTHKKPNTNYLKNTFSYSSMEVWNKIPVFIREYTNIHHFKRKLKIFLLAECD